MKIEAIYHEPTSTLTYVVFDPATRDAVVIDPVLDYNPVGSQTSTESAQKLVEWIRSERLEVHFILESHAHADHLSAAQFLKKKLGAKTVIGEHITQVQETFAAIFDMGPGFATDGRQFDRLVTDGEVINAGSLSVQVVHTPGHTPACVSYLVEDVVFVGDALFMPDYGTGRCDFPKGSSEDLYTSVHDKLYALPENTRVFVGHDYQPGGRSLQYETTIGTSKRNNLQLKATTSRDEFIRFRRERDRTLSAPRLLFQSVQVNIDAGRLPPAGPGGIRRLALPLNLFEPTDDVGTVQADASGEALASE